MLKRVLGLVVMVMMVVVVGLAGIAGAGQLDELKLQLDRIEADRFRERNERQNERYRDSQNERRQGKSGLELFGESVDKRRQQQAVVNWLADLDKIQQRDGEIDPLLATSLGMRHGVDPKVLDLYLDVLREERLRKQQEPTSFQMPKERAVNRQRPDQENPEYHINWQYKRPGDRFRYNAHEDRWE